jgi:hypothetical protein
VIPTGERNGLLMHIAASAQRFIVRADEKLTAFLELESTIKNKKMLITERLARRVADLGAGVGLGAGAVSRAEH